MNSGASNTIRVLHVDDEPDLADLTATFLEREDDRFAVETVTSASAGRESLEQRQFDCVVSDYDMPGRNGIEFLRAVRERYPDLPFLLFTGKGSEEVASDAISAGVTDYLQKGGGTDQYAVLANRITNAVEHHRVQERVERSEQRLREIVDALPHLLYVVDEEGNYLLANEALATFHDTTVEDIEGSNIAEVLDAPAAEQFRRHLDDVLETGTATRVPEVEVPDPDGETHSFEPRLQPYEFGDIDDRAVLGIATDVTERKARERTLERTRERMQLALEHTSSVIFEIDCNTDEVARHGAYDDFFDLSADEVPTWEDDLAQAVHPDDRDQFRRFYRRLVDGERDSGQLEYRTTPETGEVSWIRDTVSVQNGSDGGSRHAVGIAREITEYKQREQELERTNALLSTLFDTLPVGVLAEDEDRNVVAANEQTFELFDLPGSPDEIRGADCARLATAVSETFADSGAFVDRIEELIDEREPVYGEELELADGRTYARSYHPIALSEGDGHLWVYRDVTGRKTRETRLATLNETTQDLMAAETRTEVAEVGVEAAADVLGLRASAIHLFDEQDGLVPITQTDAGRDLVGEPPTFTGDGSIAWRVYEHGEARAIEDVRDNPNIYNPDTPVRSELILPLGEAGILIASSSTAATFDEEDRVLGEILAGNVTAALEQVERTAEIRAREAELARQNDRLAEFASVVSHDLRNPLRVAEGRLELLKEDCETDHVAAIEGALDRMDALIEDILTLAREGDEVSEMETVDLPEVCEACWQHVETAEATLETATDGAIRADRSRLQQLIENLVRNAVEHGSTSPDSHARRDAVEHGSTSPRSQAPEDAVEHGSTGSRPEADDAVEHGRDDVTVTVGDLETGFYVADDGPGVPADERESVFDAGYSTATDGTGFGLSIVKQIADAHGWDVTLTESEAGGARFEITGVTRA
mgnify:CR=1 FL=1